MLVRSSRPLSWPFLIVVTILAGCKGGAEVVNPPEVPGAAPVANSDIPTAPSAQGSPSDANPSAHVRVVYDGAEAYVDAFKTFPWGLENSSSARALEKEGIAIDFNASLMSRYFLWHFLETEETYGKSQKLKDAARAFLAKKIDSLRVNLAQFKINSLTKIVLTDGAESEIFFNGATLKLPFRVELPTEKFAAYSTLVNALTSWSINNTDGIFVTPQYLWLADSADRVDTLKQLVSDFSDKLYPLLKKSLVKNKSVVKNIVVKKNGNFEPFHYHSLSGELEIDMACFNSGSRYPQVISSLMDLYSRVPEKLSKSFSIDTDSSDYPDISQSGGNSLLFDYRGSIVGLQALIESSSVLETLVKPDQVVWVKFIMCRDFSQDEKCGRWNPSLRTLEIPVGSMDRYLPGVSRIYVKEAVVYKIKEILKKQDEE